ncbi:MAG: BatD family protein [Cytophagales bacterium]|nr:BatD family protein [Cytophagales bacterium]
MVHNIKIFFFTAFILAGSILYAQDVSVQPGKTNIALNEYFTISITVSNGELKSHSAFPDIKGLQKRGTSSQSSTNIINGRISSSQSIIQNYQAEKQGKITVPAFTINVNGSDIRVNGFTIQVGAPIQQQDPFGGDPFAEFFGRSGGQAKEYIDIKEDAFFSLMTNKSEVYVGEGFTTTLALYVAETNRAQMEFYDLANQMQEIAKKLKKPSCWVENFAITEIQPEGVTYEGKKFTRYKLYQATFYPLNAKPVVFPSLPLKMIKYKVAKNPSFFGQNMQQDFKTFTTKPVTVKVKNLPEHPLKNSVSVGNFQLEESVSKRKLGTGQSVIFNFNIKGEGNISSINKPETPVNTVFDFYEPNVKQDISRSGQAVTGSKQFSYYIVPNEPGQHDLGKYFQWIYFNPNTKKYDTLRAKTVLNVSGESKKNESIEQTTDFEGFYDRINSESNRFDTKNYKELFNLFTNILLLVMLVFSIIFAFRK